MIDLLEKAKVFRGSSRDELRAIATIAERVTSKDGESIFEAESPAEYLYVVSDGAVELRFEVTHYNATREITLDRKVSGDAFGWSALLEPGVYTISAWATRDSELLRFRASDLRSLCSENTRLGLSIMRNISEIIAERFATVQKMLVDVVQQSLIQREP